MMLVCKYKGVIHILFLRNLCPETIIYIILLGIIISIFVVSISEKVRLWIYNKIIIKISSEHLSIVLLIISIGILWVSWDKDIIHNEGYQEEILIGMHQSVIDVLMLSFVLGSWFKIYEKNKNKKEKIEYYEKNLRISQNLKGDNILVNRYLWFLSLLELKPVGGKLVKQSFDGICLQNIEIIDYDLNGTLFNNSQLENVKFKSCNLSGASFNKAILKNVSFENCELKRAYFKNSTLISSNFNSLDLKSSEFNNSNLKSSSFLKSDLESVNFKEANLNRVKFDSDIDINILLKSSNLTQIKLLDINNVDDIDKYNQIFEKYPDKFAKKTKPKDPSKKIPSPKVKCI